VVKPVMSSSGKGQSVVRKKGEIQKAWDYAVAGSRGDTKRVIVEEFIDFDYEITLLTVKQRPVLRDGSKGRTLFVRPIGHRQERGDYMESWMPCRMPVPALKSAQRMAKAVTDEIAGEGGAGIFGVEFFVKRGRRGPDHGVIFSELSPRPHDTGMVTMISQDLSEFDLHVRAILGLPIAGINYAKAAASAVILAGEESAREPAYEGIEKALALKNVQVRIFGKPSTRTYRRMGVALATAPSAAAARKLATKAASLVRVVTN
jgi:phosphoribosylglycinamide formyltransferase 2